MYNQIWSPLKQEFVDTLSTDGRQALKMYVNSFMTGGAFPNNKEEAAEREAAGTTEEEKVDGDRTPVAEGGTTEEEKVDGDRTPEPEQEQQPEPEQEAVQVNNPTSTTAPTREDSNETPKGDNTHELSEAQRKKIADEATNTANAAEQFSNNLTKVGAQAFSGSVDNLKKAVNPEVTE
jgi:hypothetical protein